MHVACSLRLTNKTTRIPRRKGEHSVFASAFIQALRDNTGIMDGSTLFTKIRRLVMLNSDQTPEYSDIRKAGHDGGDFIFLDVGDIGSTNPKKRI